MTDALFTGAIKQNGDPLWDDNVGVPKAEVLRLTDSSLRIIPHCTMGEHWDFGCVSAPEPNPTNIVYLVSYGPIIMVQAAPLTVLSLATKGRVSPNRLWRLAMHQGISEGQDDYGLGGIDYYPGITEPREQFPPPVPGLSLEKLVALESLGDIESIKNVIIHEGQFWVWMRPDW